MIGLLPVSWIRGAVVSDAAAIAKIYGHHVCHGMGSYETDAPTVEDIATRIRQVLDARWLWIVVEVEGVTLGYA